MSDDVSNESDVARQEHVKSKIYVKNCVLFAVLGCVWFLIAWFATYVVERVLVGDYSDTRAMFFFVLFFIYFAILCLGSVYKIWVGFCLSVCFMLCLLSLCYGIVLMLRHVRTKNGAISASGGEIMSRIVFVRCIISVIVSVAVIALGIWIAVRLSLISNG